MGAMRSRSAGATSARRCRRTFFVNHRAAFQALEFYSNATRNDKLDGLAGIGFPGQSGIRHTLKYFEAPWSFARVARNRLIDIGWHDVFLFVLA